MRDHTTSWWPDLACALEGRSRPGFAIAWLAVLGICAVVGTRRVKIFGQTAHPNGEWMAQMARNIRMWWEEHGVVCESWLGGVLQRYRRAAA